MTATAESDIFLRMAYSETWARANELNDAPHNTWLAAVIALPNQIAPESLSPF